MSDKFLRMRYRPKGLDHMQPRQMMTVTQMKNAFQVGGMTPAGFIGRCKRLGRELKVYRCSRGVNHYQFGEVVAKARAQNLEVTPVQESAPKAAAPACFRDKGSPARSWAKDTLTVYDCARELTGRSLRSGREIAEAAYKGGDIEKASGVYFLVSDGKVVYVGQSYNVYSRVAAHQRSKRFDAWCYVPCTGKAALDMLESMYIHHLQPEQNGRIGGTDQISVPMDLKTILKAASEVRQ